MGGLPLHLTSSSGHVDLTWILVEHGADAAESKSNRKIFITSVPGIKKERCGTVFFKPALGPKLLKRKYYIRSYGIVSGKCESVIDRELGGREAA